MYELIITGHFSSAHYLREYEGACENLHGHTWKVEVAIASNIVNKIGLVVDFKELKVRLKEMMDHWDHVCLNDLPEFKEMNPSTENMARWIFQEFKKDLPKDVCMSYARVWESDGASVLYSEEQRA